MNNNLFGVIIKVENLELCRSFYRDILELGNPVVDSNFWIEFRIGENSTVALEKKEEDEKIPVTKGRISWLLFSEDADRMLQKLKKYGIEPEYETEDKLGFRVFRLADPEGNPFYLHSKGMDE